LEPKEEEGNTDQNRKLTEEQLSWGIDTLSGNERIGEGINVKVMLNDQIGRLGNWGLSQVLWRKKGGESWKKKNQILRKGVG